MAYPGRDLVWCVLRVSGWSRVFEFRVLEKQHMKNSQFQFAGDGRPAAGVIVGCGVPREGFGMVCTPRFWVE